MPKTPDSIDKHIGTMLRTLRRARGKSQMEISEIIGVSYQQVQKYESGQSRLPASYLQRLAHYLELPVTAFLPDPHTRQSS